MTISRIVGIVGAVCGLLGLGCGLYFGVSAAISQTGVLDIGFSLSIISVIAVVSMAAISVMTSQRN